MADQAPEVIRAASEALNARLKRVETHGESLSELIQAWGNLDAFDLVPAIAEDRYSWDLVLVVRTDPDLDQWGLAFGEAVHQLRSALNSLVASVAQSLGTWSENDRNLQFPICLDSKAWNAALRQSFGALPDSVKTAIEGLQPFRDSGGKNLEGIDHPLWLISYWNNTDKHRVALKLRLASAGAKHAGSVVFEDAPDWSTPPEMTVFAPEDADGLLLRCRTAPNRIARITGNFDYTLQVSATGESGKNFGVTTSLSDLIQYTRMAVDQVLEAWQSELP
ncbi:MAG: hypothetical protein Q8M73_12075 [Actinomycetota bacterium]|nr:hypothetical protein [Actinomycetota bacterium]